jgi:hypothetical protein
LDFKALGRERIMQQYIDNGFAGIAVYHENNSALELAMKIYLC